MVAKQDRTFPVAFNAVLKLDFHGPRITSDAARKAHFVFAWLRFEKNRLSTKGHTPI
jgi:hypothetical protein